MNPSAATTTQIHILYHPILCKSSELGGELIPVSCKSHAFRIQSEKNIVQDLDSNQRYWFDDEIYRIFFLYVCIFLAYVGVMGHKDTSHGWGTKYFGVVTRSILNCPDKQTNLLLIHISSPYSVYIVYLMPWRCI